MESMDSILHGDDGPFAARPGQALPAWRRAVAVIAHPMTRLSGSAQ